MAKNDCMKILKSRAGDNSMMENMMEKTRVPFPAPVSGTSQLPALDPGEPLWTAGIRVVHIYTCRPILIHTKQISVVLLFLLGVGVVWVWFGVLRPGFSV